MKDTAKEQFIDTIISESMQTSLNGAASLGIGTAFTDFLKGTDYSEQMRKIISEGFTLTGEELYTVEAFMETDLFKKYRKYEEELNAISEKLFHMTLQKIGEFHGVSAEEVANAVESVISMLAEAEVSATRH